MDALRLPGIAALCLALCACAPPPQKLEDTKALVWPPEPEVARVAYVKEFSRPEDLGINKSFLQRIVGLLFGADESRLIRPMAVVAVGDVVYVADPGAKGVHRFDLKRGDYDLLHAEGDSALPSPVGLARGAAGEVYVADSALAQVFVIRPGAKAATPLALAAKLVQPTGLAFDAASGRLFVADTREHRVNVFRRDGTLASSFGGRGAGDGEFNYPTLLWIGPKGHLYVNDSLNFRIQIFDAQGQFLAKFGQHEDGSGELARQKGVATDRYGHVYIVDSLSHAMQIFDDAGRLLLSVGALGQERGEFWLPTGIYIDENDRIYVADSYNQRVQVLRYVGGAT
jgi:DNA-binding beta-propeller fold protein YncE